MAYFESVNFAWLSVVDGVHMDVRNVVFVKMSCVRCSRVEGNRKQCVLKQNCFL